MIYTGFWRRFFAHCIDYSIQVVIACMIMVVIGFGMGIVSGVQKTRAHVQHEGMAIQLVPTAGHYTLAQADAPASKPPEPIAIPVPVPDVEPAPAVSPTGFAKQQTDAALAAQDKARDDAAKSIITALAYIVVIVLSIVYHTGFIASKWQATPGKRVMGCMVVTREGKRLSIGHALGRHLACAISGLTLFIGYMLAGWTREKTALHDMICSTRVVRTVTTVPVIATAI